MALALITGASSGIGMECARLFAANKHDVVLVARRRDRLEAVAADLEKTNGISAHVVSADLGKSDGPGKVLDVIDRRKLEVEFLVNNAGFATTGAFAELEQARELEMIQVNVTSLVHLTRALLPGMIARKHGRILNTGSTAGFQPGPFMATYYASKAFVNWFTEALWYELQGTGVTATVLCPGATATEFADIAGNDKTRLFKAGVADAQSVARAGYEAMMRGRPMVIPGARNKFRLQLLRISPRAAVRAVAASLNQNP